MIHRYDSPLSGTDGFNAPGVNELEFFGISEPATMAILGLDGLFLLVIARRRRGRVRRA